MNILILNWRDPKHPFAGGAEIALMEHAKYWAQKGNTIIWFTSSFKGAKKEEIVENIKFIRQGSHFTVQIYALLNYLQGKFEKVDVVVDCFHFIPFFTPLYVKNKKIFALVNEVAGKLWFENLPYLFALIGFFIEPLFFKIYKNKSFIVASESTQKELVKLGIPVRAVNKVHNGSTICKVSLKITKEKKPTVLFLGRISKDKGISDGLEAFSELRLKMKDIRLWIVGKEEKKGYLQKLLNYYNIDAKSVTYFGYVDEKKKFELLKKAWMLIHPSRKEGWGLTVIEAAAQGTPTIGYNVEGLRDSILNNRTGLLTATDPLALAEGIVKLLNDKMLYNRMSKEAIRWSKKFDWKESAKKSYALLLDVRYKK